MEELELVAFQIISSVGTARSMYIEAIQLAKESKFDEAKALIQEGIGIFNEGHHAHMKLITLEAQGNLKQVPLLIIHAEDQLMSAEGFKIIAEEMIALYEKLENKQS